MADPRPVSAGFAGFSDSGSAARIIDERPAGSRPRLSPTQGRFIAAALLVIAVAVAAWLVVPTLLIRPPAEQSANSVLNPQFRTGLTQLWTLPGDLEPIATTYDSKRVLLADNRTNELLLVEARTGAEVWRKSTTQTYTGTNLAQSCALQAQSVVICHTSSGPQFHALNDAGTTLVASEDQSPLGGFADTLLILDLSGQELALEIYDANLQLPATEPLPAGIDQFFGANPRAAFFYNQQTRQAYVISQKTGKHLASFELNAVLGAQIASDGLLVITPSRALAFDNSGRPKSLPDELRPKPASHWLQSPDQNPASIQELVEFMQSAPESPFADALQSRGGLVWRTTEAGIQLGGTTVSFEELAGRQPYPHAITPCADASCVLVRTSSIAEIVDLASGEILQQLDPHYSWTPMGNYLVARSPDGLSLYRANR